MRSITACFQKPAEPPPIIHMPLEDGTVLKREGIFYPIEQIDFSEYCVGVTMVQPLVNLLQFLANTDTRVIPVKGSNILARLDVYDEAPAVLHKMHHGLMLSAQQYLTCKIGRLV